VPVKRSGEIIPKKAQGATVGSSRSRRLKNHGAFSTARFQGLRVALSEAMVVKADNKWEVNRMKLFSYQP
jgi:hypothetical protein